MKNFIVTILVLALIGGIAYFVWQKYVPSTENDETEVRTLVLDFGEKLQNVSLLAEEGLAETIEENYGPHVTPELLSEWMDDTSKAPGRYTSSPWPDRIEISEVQEEGERLYKVTGDIVEVTNEGGGIGEESTEAIRRPITLRVKNVDDKFRIYEMILSPYPGEGNWVLSPVSSQGIQFMYPSKLGATYISAQEWPPRVELVAHDFTCVEGEITAADGPITKLERHMVGGRIYCVVTHSEGAAGSTYTTYEYTTEQGDFVARILFTLRFPQCMNYDEPNRSACIAEQGSFDIDGLVDRIASSIRMM